ncbi:hypothetical protein BKA65DRAFT_258576 [Rhexocercosporidium sp. MPI-PUGE-AT-0058]|nr:hypothetical protein BKA65DRAFT_258576 [Rhexocercosporidium sp. MPI-PUGE-AT-0058]
MAPQAPPLPPPFTPHSVWTFENPPPPPYNKPSRLVFPSRKRQIKTSQEKKKSTSRFNYTDTLRGLPFTPLPFLELPCEVRIMIYKDLAPNTKPIKWCGAPQRHDGPCYTDILSVCRLIYKEALDIFYNNHVYFEIDISNNGIYFLGQRRLLNAPLPPPFRFPRSICARIQLEWRPARQKDFRNRIAEIFPVHSRLQNLQIYFHATNPAYIGRVATPEIVLAALDKTLSPLQSITKAMGPRFCITFEKHVNQGQLNLGSDLNEVVKGYFLDDDVRSESGDFAQ